MTQSISIVHCPYEGAEAEIVPVSYTITAEGAVHTISCVLSAESLREHRWLSLRKFDVRLLRERGKYTMLHNDRNDAWSRDISRFIDAVWVAILKQEAWVCV